MGRTIEIAVSVSLVAAHLAVAYTGWTTIVGHADALATTSTTTAIACAIAYLLCVAAGSRFMRDRPALVLFDAMLIYNVYEATLSLVMAILFLRETVLAGVSPFSSPVDRSPKGSVLAFALWLNYTSKVCAWGCCQKGRRDQKP